MLGVFFYAIFTSDLEKLAVALILNLSTFAH